VKLLHRCIAISSTLVLLSSLSTLFSGCDAICPPSNVSFKNCIVPTLEANCAGSGCHGGDEAAYGLVLDKDHYKNLYGTKESRKKSVLNDTFFMVDPGKADKSALYIKMLDTYATVGGDKMPPYRGNMTQAQLDMIKAWINEGAKNN